MLPAVFTLCENLVRMSLMKMYLKLKMKEVKLILRQLGE